MGPYYEKRAAEQQDDEATPAKKARRSETDRPSEVEEQVENIECKYCGKSFKSEEAYNKHVGEVHPSEKNIFTCPFCAEPFGRFIGYIDHLKEHEDRVIRCKDCKKVCNTLSRLRIHQKIHVNQCPFCAANFSSKDELVNNMYSLPALALPSLSPQRLGVVSRSISLPGLTIAAPQINYDHLGHHFPNSENLQTL